MNVCSLYVCMYIFPLFIYKLLLAWKVAAIGSCSGEGISCNGCCRLAVCSSSTSLVSLRGLQVRVGRRGGQSARSYKSSDPWVSITLLSPVLVELLSHTYITLF